jgi:hypothetical protein
MKRLPYFSLTKNLNQKTEMKRIPFNLLISLSFVIGILFLTPGITFAQAEKASQNVELTTWKYSDGTRSLIDKVTASGENGNIPVAGLTITFINPGQGKDNILGTAVTAADGRAVFTVSANTRLSCNDKGIIRFLARSEENDQYQASEISLEVKDARIEIGFAEVDSVRKITYRGVIINAKGEEEPLANTDVFFFVPRMFSMLKVVDGWLGEDGKGESDFPLTLSGDSAGVIKIHARIEENADFGNLEAVGVSNWASKKHGSNPEGPQRELWTPIAPMWMIITLIVMLAGVWAHYIYAVVQLVLINKAGKAKKEKPK